MLRLNDGPQRSPCRKDSTCEENRYHLPLAVTTADPLWRDLFPGSTCVSPLHENSSQCASVNRKLR
jgi:hypothetical protein